MPDSVVLLAFEFHGMSFKTRPEAMVFHYRLAGLDEDWKITHQKRVEYEGLSVGSYVFEVQTVDRDLVYSEQVAQVAFEVRRDERDERIDELEARVQERTAQLVQAEKMSALGNMVAGLAHELNNPAGAMTGAMDVLDRGIARRGMPPEVVARIYEPGYKAGSVRIGTGLGLSISANTAQKHNGRFDVTSQEGKGSTFVVRFPIQR